MSSSCRRKSPLFLGVGLVGLGLELVPLLLQLCAFALQCRRLSLELGALGLEVGGTSPQHVGLSFEGFPLCPQPFRIGEQRTAPFDQRFQPGARAGLLLLEAREASA